MEKSTFQSAISNKFLIGVRTIELELDETIIGFVSSFDEECFIINEIDPYGYFIGNTTILFDNVINIDIGDRYLHRLQFIFDNKNFFDKNNEIKIYKNGFDLVPNFDFLITNNIIATFNFNEGNYLIGILLEYDSLFLKVKCIGTEGDEDGVSIYQIRMLTSLKYNGIEEQKIKLLYENRNKFY